MLPQNPDQSKPRILIVDDERLNLQLLSRVFESSFEVDTATNGKVALDLIEKNEYDVVLLDIMMPVMNGLEALEVIRKSKDLMTLPIILISAVAERSDVARGIRMGANDYISKPVDVDVVMARVTTQVMIKQLIDEHNHNINQLQQANAAKVRMMQVASHDLKNPINNLKMVNKIMQKEVDSENQNPTAMNKLIKLMDDSLEEMLTVIKDFLDNEFASTHDFAMDIEKLSCKEIVEQVISNYQVAAVNKDINVTLGTGISEHIRADKSRLLQAIGNLLSNAIKYSPLNGTVTLSGEVRDDRWRLYIKDEGDGISEDERPYLFQPFSKNKISTQPTAGEDSTGLGLWIVKQMIDLQSGNVGVDFPEAGGSVFWLELPLATEKAKA